MVKMKKAIVFLLAAVITVSVFYMPTNGAFDQHNESTPSGSSLDKDAVSGRDHGEVVNTKYSGYNRQDARAYANRWYNDYNDQYHKYSADCANFVSQCLAAGGIPMNEAWYSCRITDNDKDTSKEEMSNEASVDSDFHVGEPWRLAKKEYEYFKDAEYGYRNGDVIEITSTQDIPSVLARCAAEGIPIQTGDLMFFAYKGEGEGGVHHAAMISYADLNCIKYTSHTDPQFDKDLSGHLTKNNVFIIRLHDSNE